jgi:glycosyltransferase involved in cell wall biosynthesis
VGIALVCDYSLEYMGGAQSVFLDEVELFRSTGEDVLVVAPAPSRARPSGLHDDDLLVPGTGSVPGAGLPVIPNTRALRRRLRRAFEERGVDVVHVHSEFGLTAAAGMVAREMRIPVVHTVHTFYWQGPNLGPFDGAMASVIRGLARRLRGAPSSAPVSTPRALDASLRGITLAAALEADAVISPSAHQAEALREAGLTDVEVVPNPMRAKAAPGEPLREIDGPLRIVWVGRLAPEKRLLEFLEAVVRAGDQLEPRSLDVTIVGEGPLLAEARRVASAASLHGGSVIRFTGRVDRDEVARLMSRSHLVALTSFGFDNQPVVVVEAFHAARSVVYVDPRLQEGLAEAGILTASPDVDGMAATLLDLARHPETVVARSQQTVEASQRFRPERHVQDVRAVWDAAATRASARA